MRERFTMEGAESMPRVLVVDDDRDIRRLLHIALESEEFEVATAQNGDEALAFLRAARDPWIVLLDVLMPGRSGLEVCSALEDPSWDGTRHIVVLMSASVSFSVDPSPIVRQVVQKPFRVADLIDLIRTLAEESDDTQQPGASGEKPGE
jgi:CheY-like chemotaxis protein